MSRLDVIFEDNHLLVINKPAGVITMGAEDGSETLVEMAAGYLKRKYNKPGRAFVGVVSRLDKLASGVIVFARTSKAASRLSDQIRRHTWQKRYVACVEGTDFPAAAAGWFEWSDWMRKNDRHHRMEICDSGSSGAQQAKLRAQFLAQENNAALLNIDLQTGRKHQIRLQCSSRGWPIWGDAKYGASRPFSQGIALHCYQLRVEHPTLKKPMSFSTAPTKWAGMTDGLQKALEDHCGQSKH